MGANQPTDRQRLAAVLETLARVLRSEAAMTDEIYNVFEDVLCLTLEFLAIGLKSDLSNAEHHATKAAKLAGVEVAKAVGDE